jgi:hypothetical protein
VLCAVVATSADAAATLKFTQTPPAQTNQVSATFKWTPTGSFLCTLDGGTATTCTSPHPVTGLSEGPHTFTVAPGPGASGGISPITYQWTVDLTPPTTVVTQQPPALTSSTSATFVFNSPDSTATFLCSLNGAPAVACTSPVMYTGLADATRTLLIQAEDPAGNLDTQAQPITWTVDTTPPDTTLANPGNITGNVTPQFTFTSTEMNSTFECSLNGAAFAACTTPDVVDIPKSGHDTFAVRAIDPAGNVDPTPATFSWTSDLTPPKRPTVTIFPRPSSATASRAAPVLKVEPTPHLGLTFTNPLSTLLGTPPFSLQTRLQAQWKSDASAVSYDVTVTTFPEGSTGQDEHGDDVLVTKQYSRTKRTALRLTLFTGETVCVKVDARDKVGNVSRTRESCTSVPDSFAPPWGPFTFDRVRDSKAWRGFYLLLKTGSYLDQPVNDSAFFAPSRAVLVGERCHGCGSVEFAFTKYPVGARPLHSLATVNMNGKLDHQRTFNVTLPHRRLERDGEGVLVILKTSGKPRLSGVGFS